MYVCIYIYIYTHTHTHTHPHTYHHHHQFLTPALAVVENGYIDTKRLPSLILITVCARRTRRPQFKGHTRN